MKFFNVSISVTIETIICMQRASRKSKKFGGILNGTERKIGIFK